MKKILVLLVLLWAVPANAANVVFDAGAGATVADANGWTSTLYVNNVAFPLTHTCALVATVVTCTATLPDVSKALTPSGAQTFEVSFRDTILNVESPRSLPFIRVRPGAPTNGRFS